MAENLKHCPACGSSSAVVDGFRDGFQVNCHACFHKGRKATFQWETVAWWNEASAESDIQILKHELRTALEANADLLAACEHLLFIFERTAKPGTIGARACDKAKEAIKKARVDNNAQKGGEV